MVENEVVFQSNIESRHGLSQVELLPQNHPWLTMLRFPQQANGFTWWSATTWWTGSSRETLNIVAIGGGVGSFSFWLLHRPCEGSFLMNKKGITLPILRQRDDKYLVAASKWLPAFNCRVGTIFVQLDRGWLTRRSVWTLEWVSNWLVHGPPGTSRSYMVDTAWIR